MYKQFAILAAAIGAVSGAALSHECKKCGTDPSEWSHHEIGYCLSVWKDDSCPMKPTWTATTVTVTPEWCLPHTTSMVLTTPVPTMSTYSVPTATYSQCDSSDCTTWTTTVYDKPSSYPMTTETPTMSEPMPYSSATPTASEPMPYSSSTPTASEPMTYPSSSVETTSTSVLPTITYGPCTDCTESTSTPSTPTPYMPVNMTTTPWAYTTTPVEYTTPVSTSTSAWGTWNATTSSTKTLIWHSGTAGVMSSSAHPSSPKPTQSPTSGGAALTLSVTPLFGALMVFLVHVL